MVEHLKHALRGQFEAALAMLEDCLIKCPAEHWDSPIARYPFWHVAYHALCFVDCYLSPSNEDFGRLLEERKSARATDRSLPDLHPLGAEELEAEHPSRRFSRDELRAYVGLCRAKLEAVLGDGPGGETWQTLLGPSGFEWLRFPRLELHIYNIRHVQHHA
ncbi:MAG TPA: DinB family protein, partial [Phycisphaerales bacterium]|nr:DinB family protein [Phycisphaerales bacterium]